MNKKFDGIIIGLLSIIIVLIVGIVVLGRHYINSIDEPLTTSTSQSQVVNNTQTDITGRDGRFIAYNNGTVLDTKTNLMWAGKDNGYGISWENAKSYCENYRGGGYTDWRMPTQNELARLFDRTKARPAACQANYSIYLATKFIDITCFSQWASETRGYEFASFYFGDDGIGFWDPPDINYIGYRALPVRNGKVVMGFTGSTKSDEPMPITENNVRKYIKATIDANETLTAKEQEEVNEFFTAKEQKKGQNNETKIAELVKRRLVEPLEKMGYGYDKTIKAAALKIVDEDYTQQESLLLGIFLTIPNQMKDFLLKNNIISAETKNLLVKAKLDL